MFGGFVGADARVQTGGAALDEEDRSVRIARRGTAAGEQESSGKQKDQTMRPRPRF
jgi:hypothetical protein